ncbi:uncharacterized protein LOC106737364 [Alligator mississippiensis]|uniref:uncharacterized protein LOC106737364 n=1 Tax=Alligator mississippiensis TaxID=8496 RepID=UPI0006ECBFE8|nr:uncharacterized protein LOC106737364 [Alligator mississippiensis]
MGLPVLLGCVSLWAGLALAEVGSFSSCQKYLYKKAEPEGFNTQHTAKICQKYDNAYHYATLYDKESRTPRWSAYMLTVKSCENQPQRRKKWFVEPQLLSQYKSPEMSTEEYSSGLTLEQLQSTQAISRDYGNTNYDRGQLNPNSFQCDSGRTATFTLTNTVPMNHCFNQMHWRKLEESLRDKLKKNCFNGGGTAYLVTGAVAGTEKIPKKADQEWDRQRTYDRVAVASHIWTAVCCDNANNNLKFSFAFLAENKEESKLRFFSVEQLNKKLQEMYNTQNIRVLADDCNAQSQKTQEVLSAIKQDLYSGFWDLMLNLYHQVLPSDKRKNLDKETTKVMKSRNVNQGKVQLGSIEIIQEVDSTKDWHELFVKAYEQDSLSCMLSHATDATGLAYTSGTSGRVCAFQKQKHLPVSDVSAQGYRCFGQACGKHNGEPYSWCYISANKDWDYCCTEKCMKDYRCARGDGGTATCSPQYSTVTVKGHQCRADFPCGLYHQSYYWCYTDYRQNWDYCCAPHHYCGKHGYSYQWCYVGGQTKDWQNCKA